MTPTGKRLQVLSETLDACKWRCHSLAEVVLLSELDIDTLVEEAEQAKVCLPSAGGILEAPRNTALC